MTKQLATVRIWATMEKNVAYARIDKPCGPEVIGVPFTSKPLKRAVLLPSEWHDAAFTAGVQAYRLLQARHPELDMVMTMAEVVP